MNARSTPLWHVLTVVVIALSARMAHATTIQDLVRIKGHERNTLVGLGIVVGLNGTGDRSKDSMVAARPYEQLLANLGDPIESLTELEKADAYAIVQVTMEVPATGVRAGDRVLLARAITVPARPKASGCTTRTPLPVALPSIFERSASPVVLT